MKQAFFLFNILLAAVVLGMTTFNIMKKDESVQEYSVKKGSKKTAAVKPQPNRSIRTKPEEQEQVIVNQNLFNPARNPLVQGGGMAPRQVQLTLVGVSMVGKWKGAIILQKTAARPPMPFGMPMRGQQQRQVQQAVQQYVRVGERLPNGYILTEVTRTGVVLTLNGNRMELKLQEASKNQPQAAPRRPRTNTTNNLLQQMLQMQRTQQWQMMRLMRQGGGAQAPQPGAPAGNRGGQPPRRR